jgi:prepilin-type N-terminal cleavage/methylation domain-containing protein
LRKEAGFTLVELLVVIAILGLLASLILAVLASAKKRALQIECVNNVRSLDSAIQLFVDDNHAYPFF